MNRTAAETTVDIQTVEALLSARPKGDGTECAQAALIAASVGGVADSEETAAALAHLSDCSECRAAVLLLHGIESQLHLTSTPSTEPVAAHPRRAFTGYKPLAWAAAATMVLVTAVFFSYRESHKPEQPQSAFTVKGAEDLLSVAVKRGAAEFSVRALDRLESGDQIGFFYGAGREGFLAVFNIDEDNSVTRLFPALQTVSAPIQPTERTPLSDGAVVRDGRGCEWVAAVFSDAPLDLNETAERLRHGGRSGPPETCRLTVRIPGARTVVVLPFIRN